MVDRNDVQAAVNEAIVKAKQPEGRKLPEVPRVDLGNGHYRVELPSGGWFEYRDPEDLTMEEREEVDAALSALATDDARDAPKDVNTLNKPLARLLITAWSYEQPVPHIGGIDVLRKIKARDWDCIRIALNDDRVSSRLWWRPDPKPDAPPSDPTPSSALSVVG